MPKVDLVKRNQLVAQKEKSFDNLVKKITLEKISDLLTTEVALGNLLAEMLPARLQKLDTVPDLKTKDGISMAKKRIGQMGFFEETSMENLKRLQNIKKDKKVSQEIEKKEERSVVLYKILDFLENF